MYTLIITTFNRPKYLSRLLQFLNSFNIPLNILIADASEFIYQAQNRSILKDYSNLKINYMSFNSYEDTVRMLLLSTISCHSPFVAYCHDDDFIFPDFLEEAVEYLFNNLDYAVCNGRYSLIDANGFRIQSNKLHDDPDPLKRFEDGLSNLSPTLFAVWRREVAIKTFTSSMLFPHGHDMREPLLTCFCTLFGKIHVLDKVSILHVLHGANIDVSLPQDRYQGHTITSGTFSADIKLVVELIDSFNLPYNIDIAIWDINEIFIRSLLKFFAGYAFIFQGSMMYKLSTYPVGTVDIVERIVYQVIGDYFKIDTSPSNFDGGYPMSVFSSLINNPRQDSILVGYELFKEEQVKSRSETFNNWQNIISDSDFSTNYTAIKYYTVSNIVIDLDISRMYELFDLIFLKIFFCSISGSYIQSFEPAVYISERLQLFDTNSVQRQYVSRALDILEGNPKPI